MRIGSNPNKDKVLLKSDFFHQVIVPVYIPNQEGYFKDSFVILRYCLQSLFKTSHRRTYFTIVNNGSCDEIVTYLNSLHQENKIHELIHTTNIGKFNAIFKGLVGSSFQLVTITDADVLFLNDWQKATYEVFEAFPKAGVVSPVPIPKACKYLSAHVFFENLFNNSIKVSKVKNAEALKKFAISLNNVSNLSEIHFEKQITIQKNNVISVIGSGHFVATYKADIFEELNSIYSDYIMGTGEGLYLDSPSVRFGYWRLSTENNYAYHLGNTCEDWMQLKFEELKDDTSLYNTLQLLPFSRNKFYIWISQTLFKRIIYHTFIWGKFLKNKGLSDCEVADYN